MGGSSHHHDEKFPRRLAFSVWIVQLYNGIQYSEIFTLAVYVVRRFEGPDATEQRIGQLSGLLAAASSFAVGAAAWPWGLFSDRIGRKPVILLGNCSTATCIVLFSLAGRYWQALLFRFLAGILDGSLVMTKVMVGEKCSPYMQAQVMSYLALGDAMGNIIGPAMGGLLSDPCRFGFLGSNPLCSNESALLIRHPFLLPCALTAALGVLTTLVNIFYMEETLGSQRGDYVPLKSGEGAEVGGTPTPKRADASEAAAEGGMSMSEAVGEQLPDMEMQEELRSYRSSGVGDGHPGKQHQELEMQVSGTKGRGRRQELEDSSPSGTGRDSGGTSDDEQDSEHVRLLDRTSSGVRQKGRDLEAGSEDAEVAAAPQQWWRNRPLVIMLMVTSWMLSIAKYNDELGPVYVSAPIKQGGLGMPLSEFSGPLSFAGVVLTLFALFCYPPLQRAVGLKMTCALGLLVGIPGDLLLPTAGLVRSHRIAMQAVIYSAIAITKLTTQTAFTSSMVIINSLAPRAQLGSVNGIRMTMAALGRSSGPILGGTLWGLSTTLHFPGHHYLGFTVASVALVGCWALLWFGCKIPCHIGT